MTKLEKTENRLYRWYDQCYKDDSNPMFDELHDDLLYQIRGFNCNDDESDLDEVNNMLDQVEAYYNLTQSINEIEIEWVYG